MPQPDPTSPAAQAERIIVDAIDDHLHWDTSGADDAARAAVARLDAAGFLRGGIIPADAQAAWLDPEECVTLPDGARPGRPRCARPDHAGRDCHNAAARPADAPPRRRPAPPGKVEYRVHQPAEETR